MSVPALLPTDVLVLGAGPAGSTAATLLARHGIGVTVLGGPPGAGVGASACLPPGAVALLEELGVADTVRSLPHTRPVEGVTFRSQDDTQGVQLPFNEALAPALPQGLAVHRQELDETLLALARASAAEVLQGWSAANPVWEGNRLTGVVAITPGGTTRQIHARAVLDATGQGAFLASRMGWRFGYPRHRKVALQQWRSALQPVAEGASWTTYARLAGGWLWSTPLAGNAVAVSAVLDSPPRSGPPLDAEALLAAAARAPSAARLLAATSSPSASALYRDFSYRVMRVAGDGFCLLGDASGFFDPVVPFGVLAALATAACAAQDVAEAFARHGRVDAADFGPTIALTRRLHRLAFALARALHDPRFHRLLLQPPHRLGLRAALVSLLAGDVVRDGVWRRSVRFRALRLLSRVPRVGQGGGSGQPPAAAPAGGGQA
jgi:hypothetical protein